MGVRNPVNYDSAAVIDPGRDQLLFNPRRLGPIIVQKESQHLRHNLKNQKIVKMRLDRPRTVADDEMRAQIERDPMIERERSDEKKKINVLFL